MFTIPPPVFLSHSPLFIPFTRNRRFFVQKPQVVQIVLETTVQTKKNQFSEWINVRMKGKNWLKYCHGYTTNVLHYLEIVNVLCRDGDVFCFTVSAHIISICIQMEELHRPNGWTKWTEHFMKLPISITFSFNMQFEFETISYPVGKWLFDFHHLKYG